LTIDLEAAALELEENVPNARQGILGRLNLEAWRSSSKIEALVEELSNLRMQNATTKSLVFSQFVNFLDLIAYRLQRAGFKVSWFGGYKQQLTPGQICRLEGTMSPQARDATIQHFCMWDESDILYILIDHLQRVMSMSLSFSSVSRPEVRQW
jgi:DNA repair protein RAD16